MSANSAQTPDTAAEDSSEQPPELPLRGASLTDEESAALLVVLARLAEGAQQRQDNPNGQMPADRRIERRRRLANHHGMWGQPGTGSWKIAAGVMG